MLGKVDVETDNVDDFKEVSSRDGGLIDSEATRQLMDYFSLIHRRLERYVVGVLWGEGFVRKDYFVNERDAAKYRKTLQAAEKDSDSPDHVFYNIGSKVDFLQLIKSLVNDSNIRIKYYNEELADIVSDASSTEVLQAQMIDDLRKVANTTNDPSLLTKISEFEQHIAELLKQKEEAERQKKDAEAKAAETEEKRKEEEKKRKTAEKERDARIQQNIYLNSSRDTSKEVEDLMHTVLISSTDLDSLITVQESMLEDNEIDVEELSSLTKDMRFNVERIHLLSSLITRANVSLLRESQDIDLYTYAKEFLQFFSRTITVSCSKEEGVDYVKKIPVLEFSIVLQNVISNSRKAKAKEVGLFFKREGRSVIIDVSDSGNGVDLEKFTAESIFWEGVTDRDGGAGIGLSTIRDKMRTGEMNGDILFVGNNHNGMSGATFRLIFR